MSQGSQADQQKKILACIKKNMNQSSLSHKLQRNVALASNIMEEPSKQLISDNNSKQKMSKKKIFEYRGSTDLASRQLQQQQLIQATIGSRGGGVGTGQSNTEHSRHQLAKFDDYQRNHMVEPPQGGHLGSFGLSEIKSPNSMHAPNNNLAKNQHGAVDIVTRTSAYQLKRQQVHRQNGRHVQKEAAGIVGRQVDAPHIIVPQGPICKNDYEAREQGTIGVSAPTSNTLHLMQARGHQTISLSPKHSPWKKTSKGSTSNNFARGKPKNLFGQVKLNFAQSGTTGKTTTSHQNQQTKSGGGERTSQQKNFKSQSGKQSAGDGGKNSRASKSMEQVRQHRQPNFAAAAGHQGQQQQTSSTLQHKTGQRHQQQSSTNNESKKIIAAQGQQMQQAAGRKTVMHNHSDKPDLASIDVGNKQRRSGATTRQQQRSQLNNFLDTSLIQQNAATSIQIQNHHGSSNDQNQQQQITLNILTATADQFANQGGNAVACSGAGLSAQAFYPTGGAAKCKSAVARQHPTKEHGRQLIQTKYLNFQRDAQQHNQNNSKKRSSKSVQEHNAAASRANHHRETGGGTRARTALAAQAQTTIATRVNSKGAVVNPFQQISSSQGRASGSGGGTSTGHHSRAFGASKNQTIEIELRRRSKSKQGGVGGQSGILSDTPDKNRQRARSGGSSNKRKQQILGVSASFSPRSRATTQFQEARSLLENQSSGLSVNSKKQNLNQLLQNLEGRHKKQQQIAGNKPIAGSQEYIAAANQSSTSMIQGGSQQVVPASGGVSAVNLTTSAALDPTYNLSSILLQQHNQNPTDPNNSVQQYSHHLRVSNDNLRSSTIAPETQVGDESAKMVNLNASLGRILNQSSLIHVSAANQQQRGGGSSQSPKGNRALSRGAIGQQATKGSNVISASNTSRIDKIIQENLKKQSKKTLQKRLREAAEEQVSRKKKAELELVNERVRNTNKEKVQRRKLQQMLLMQTNHTVKAAKSVANHQHHIINNDPTADQIRDEMTRMLDELPENAIVKSQHKATSKHHENINNQTTQQQAPLNSTSQPKQLQARTQKIDLKFNSQQRMDGLIMRVQKQTSQNQNNTTTQVNQQSSASSNKQQKSGATKAPPKTLVVNRLAVTKKDSSDAVAKSRAKNNYSQLQMSQDLNNVSQNNFNHNHLQDSGTVPALIESSGKIGQVARFKDHRKSYGLEFIDIRKEINAELKEFRPSRKSPRAANGKSTNKAAAAMRAANLRYIPKDKAALGADNSATIENGILIGGKNLRGSKSQRQVLANQSANETSALEEGLNGSAAGPANADLNVLRMMNQSVIAPNQTAILKPGQVHITALRIKPPGAGDKKVHQSMTTNGGGLGIILKKEKIRKFMLRKQKQKQEEEEKTKMDEIQKTLKVHQNLTKLDKFAKRTLKVINPPTGQKTGKVSKGSGHGTLRHRNNIAVRKNMTIINDQPEQSESIMPSGHNMTVTPSKTALEVSEPSFNISAKLNTRVSSKQIKKVNKAHQKDISNAATHNLQIDHSMAAPDTSLIHQTDGGNSSSRNRHRRSSQSRRTTDHYANRSINQLAPQFENSTSAKTLRTQLRKQNSSQSPPPQTSSHATRIIEAPSSHNIKHSTGGRKSGATLAQNKISKAALQSGKEPKNLKVGKKSIGASGAAANSKQQRKRGKSTNRRSGGGCTIQLNNNRQFQVRVPEAGGLTSKRSFQNHQMNQQQIAVSMGAGQGGLSGRIAANQNHQHHNSQHKSSIQTLESQDSHTRRHQSSQWRHRRPSSLVTAQNLSREGAAAVIQKEVRKYLKQIGFYHARQIDHPSPDQEPQISLFIERRQHQRSSKSRGDSAKRSNQGQSSRSGSRGLRQQPSPSQQHRSSHPHSPDIRDRSHTGEAGMQETTIIAQISGLRKTDLFDDIDHMHQDGDIDESFISHHMQQIVARTTNSQQRSSTQQKSKKSSGGGQRKSAGRPRQQSSSSERGETSSAKRLHHYQQHSSGRKHASASKQKSGQKQQQQLYQQQQQQQEYLKELKAQPIRQLNPVFKDLHSDQHHHSQKHHIKSAGGQQQSQQEPHQVTMLHEILSVQTLHSRRTSKHQVINLENHEPPSPQSLSAHRISDSEFEFRQAQSSVESGSMERHAVNTMNGGHSNNGLVHDGASQSSNSLFDRNAFQQYSQKKLKVIMQNSEQSKLIKFREEVLKFKEKKERKHIKKLFKQNQFSPRTFQAKQQQIDRWVQVQKQDIERTKTTFKEEWEKTVQMIDDTQKNVDQMKSKMNLGPSHLSNSGVVSVSGTSAAKQNSMALNAANQLNNFNSQSCNSLSSHRNYQRGGGQSTTGNNQLALSGLGEHQRSILIEDPPKSYRSGRQEIPQMQILPIQGGVLPENNPGGEDTGHGSMGLLSSRRSANGNQGDNLHMAQSLLQYMEQRLASHNEQKQTSLSELKSKNGQQSDINLQDVDMMDEEQELKQAMDQIDIKAPPVAAAATSTVLLKDQIQVDTSQQQALTKSQQMIGLSGALEKGHSGKPSSASNIESEMSHQPSAEFLERLERVNKQEPFISSNISDKLLGSGDFTGFDEPLLPSALQSDTADPIGGVASNQPDELLAKDSEKPPKLIASSNDQELMSQTENFDRGNFKNQVMTIKDFGGIDSKRTSQQSETSNEKDFMRMLANQKNRNHEHVLNNNDSNAISPTAEHLEEPSIVGKREQMASMESAQTGPDAAQSTINTAPHNIRIADMLKHQSKDIEEIIKDQNSHRSDTSPLDEAKLLQEPAIISSSQTLEVGPSSSQSTINADQSSSSILIDAKTKMTDLSSVRQLEDLESIIKSGDSHEKNKLIDQLTDEVMKLLIDGCVNDAPLNRNDSQSSLSPKKDQSDSSGQPNHDVYYIDQLQSEKEERKEWIELRQRHLIENDLIRIDQYVNEIVEALLQFDIDLTSDEDEDLLNSKITESARERRRREQADNYHIQFLKQLTQPIQKSANEVLQLLQTSEIGSYKHFETTQDLQKYPIIPVNLYLEIEKAREEALLARKGQNMSKQTQMVWESIHIQNKSFFDAINESLMKFRPYGLTGEPMPWSNKIRRLQTKVDIGSVDTERLFQMVKQEVFRWSQAFCGALPSPVFCFPISSGPRDKEEFNDELFQENREKRLTQVLSAETVEQEHHWLNYEYEEAQVKVDLSDMILEHLVDELATFLNQKSQNQIDQPLADSQVNHESGLRDSNVEIYELMRDEPEFANAQGPTTLDEF